MIIHTSKKFMNLIFNFYFPPLFMEGFKSVSLQDKTSMFTIMTLVGPKAKDMMTEICETEVDMQPFTFRFFNMRYFFLHFPPIFSLSSTIF